MNCKAINNFLNCSSIAGRLNSGLINVLKRQNFTQNKNLAQTHTTRKNGPKCFERRCQSTCVNRALLTKPSLIKPDSCWSRKLCVIANTERICWNCNRKIGKEIFFCKLCKIIQPPLNELSLFEMFRSPETFDIDVKKLTENYRKLQAMLHPDKFGNTDDKQQQYSAEQSSLINKAYNIILDPLCRAVYLLELNDVHIGEKNTIEDPEFLMEVMEINESLTEVTSNDDLDVIRVKNNESIDHCIEGISTAFSEGNFDLAKELVVKLRYHQNILDIIKDKILQLE